MLLPVLLILSAFSPAPPGDVALRVGEGRVIVRWSAPPGAQGYQVYRAAEGEAFAQITPAAIRPTFWVDSTVTDGTTYRYFVRPYAGGQAGAPSDTLTATPGPLSDDAFLDLVSRTAFDFLWYEANPASGLIRDRSTPGSPASIAAVGFGLAAYGVAVEKGWITRGEARARTLVTLEFLWSAEQSTARDAAGYKGFFYHFLDLQTGKRAGTTELSTIDTALLMGGVLYAGQFFDGDDPGEARIRELTDALYRRVDWNWASPRPPLISHGWTPERGFIPYDYGGYSEAMILYLLALGSPTHAVAPAAWDAWTRGYTYSSLYSPGKPFVTFPPLFGHQYSHIWVDFRGIQDAYMRARTTAANYLDYFENSRRATLAQRNYAIANPRGFAGYDADGWGITASDYPGGYLARGVPPVQNDDGTLVPTAPGGSYAFAPDESLAALRRFYDAYPKLWGVYGFKDAVNPTKNWTAADHIGIDQGAITLMIENGRSDAVWKYTMQAPAIQAGLERAGFTPAHVSAAPPDAPAAPGLAVHPNPARGDAVARVSDLPAGGGRLVLFDMLGRRVWSAEITASGTHRLPLDGLAAGLYVLHLSTSADLLARPFFVMP